MAWPGQSTPRSWNHPSMTRSIPFRPWGGCSDCSSVLMVLVVLELLEDLTLLVGTNAALGEEGEGEGGSKGNEVAGRR